MGGPDAVRIFVGGLSWETSERDLEDAFSRFGKVVVAEVCFLYSLIISCPFIWFLCQEDSVIWHDFVFSFRWYDFLKFLKIQLFFVCCI